MTHQDDQAAALKKDAKAVNREGWKEESKGQLEKIGAKITGNKVKEAEGRDRQMQGNAMKHEGKAGEHAADAVKEMDKAANPKG